MPPTAVDKSDAPLAMAAWVAELVTGGRAVLDGHYNGKIDSVRLFAGAIDPAAVGRWVRSTAEALAAPQIAAVWDFAQDTTTTRIRDLTPNRLDGQIVNLPARAMKGWNWDGTPDELAAGAGAVRRHPFPRRRHLRLRLADRLLVPRARRPAQRHLCRLRPLRRA